MKKPQTTTSGAGLVGRAGLFEHRLAIQHAEGVQACETLRAIEQGAGIVFRLHLAVSHPCDSRCGGEIGKRSRRIDSSRSTRSTCCQTDKTRRPEKFSAIDRPFHEDPVLWGCFHRGPSHAPGGK
jgi:hypothetical protein